MENLLTEKEAQADTKKCPNCGAGLKFSIKLGELKCNHCGTVVDIDDDNDMVQRRDITDDIIKSHENWKEGTVFRCDNCGAKSVLDKKDMAKSCAFCGSSHIVSSSELAGIKPDSVIPFQVTRISARDRFKKWIKARFFAPRALKKQDIDEHMQSVYTSSWSFSSRTESKYNGTLGRNVTTTRTVNGRTEMQRTIQWFRVNGNIKQNYIDYFIQSGTNISSKMFEKIKPFSMTQIKLYRQEYLSGIIAEHYSRNLESCFKDFQSFVRHDLQRRIMRLHNADHVSALHIDTQYHDKKFNYVLLPLYISHFDYKKKNYNFYVNGSTGKIVGKYPLSVFKIALVALLGIAAIAAAVILYYM